MKGLKRYETEKREDITDADGEVEWIILASRDHRPQKASGYLPNTHTLILRFDGGEGYFSLDVCTCL